MKISDRVKVVNPNSSFCGEEGSVVQMDRNLIDVHLDGLDHELTFYFHELELLK